MTDVSASRLSSQDFRGNFPMLDHGVYLASCSLGARSTALDGALQRLLSVMSTNPGSAAWHIFENEVETARKRFALFIGARPEQVAVMPNASVCAYQVISTISLGGRKTIVTSVEEFPSVAHVWLGQRRRAAEVRRAENSGRSDLATDVRGYERAVDNHTALVSVPLVAYESGALLPVAEIAKIAHAHGSPVFVDAYQAVGVLPVDVNDLECDYLVGGLHKYMLGLPGVTFLYARASTGLDPTLTGWFGRVDPFAFNAECLDFPDSARRFQTGTAAVPTLFAANAGLDLVSGLDLHTVRSHVHDLMTQAGRLLVEQGEEIRMPLGAAAQGAHFGLVDRQPEQLAQWLSERGIAVSPRGRLVRLSFHFYNNLRDVERLCAALQEYRWAHADR